MSTQNANRLRAAAAALVLMATPLAASAQSMGTASPKPMHSMKATAKKTPAPSMKAKPKMGTTGSSMGKPLTSAKPAPSIAPAGSGG